MQVVTPKPTMTNDPTLDSDGDGLLDGEEINKYKTDALKYDTDGDGASDGWKVLNSYDPLKKNEPQNII